MAATPKSKSFSVLPVEGDESYQVDDEISFSKVVKEAVQSALNNPETSEPDISACCTHKPSRPKGSDTKPDQRVPPVADVIEQVIIALQPLIIQTVTAAISASSTKILTDIRSILEGNEKEKSMSLSNVKKEVQNQRFELDRPEQYSMN